MEEQTSKIAGICVSLSSYVGLVCAEAGLFHLSFVIAGSIIVFMMRRTGYRQAADTAKSRFVISGEGVSVIASLRHRRSIFPRDYSYHTANDGSRVPVVEVEKSVVRSLLEAASWAPFHGSVPPWKFIVLGRSSMVKMQELTLDYYDRNWQEVGWADMASPVEGESVGMHRVLEEAAYQKWRAVTRDEIHGRWGPVSYMIAIVMRRQAGSRRVPQWEEAAATSAAVQNMWIQASEAFPGLACYWSSWHEAVRDSRVMADFLGMDWEGGDRCFGFFIVATTDPNTQPPPDRRHPRWKPTTSNMSSSADGDIRGNETVEWRN